MRFLILFLFSVLLFGACQRPGAQNQNQNASADAKRFPLKGKVIAVDRATKEATVEHGDIPGYMGAMTMKFPVRADWVWDDLTPGSEIRADLVIESNGAVYWLENLGIVAAPNPDQPPVPVDERFAQIGQVVPDFSLTNQDGKHISVKDFRGKALAITFVYTKCPLPEYCTKMSTNFSDLAMQVKDDAAVKDKIRLLTISFDPERDTPAKLKEYGTGYYGQGVKPDFNLWQLAVGKDAEVRKIADFFGLRYEVDPSDKTQINHSLRTAVIAPDGKVTKILSGNDWTPNDLLREMEMALKSAQTETK